MAEGALQRGGVAADRGREAIGPKGPFNARAGPDHVRRGQGVAHEQKSGVLIGNRERPRCCNPTR